MQEISPAAIGIVVAASLFCAGNVHAADSGDKSRIERVVDETIRPMMDENNIPGMAVAVTVGGESYFYNYGVASKETGQKVDGSTIFEIGSISKTFTATLASYAQARGAMSLSDNAGTYLPALAGSSLGKISLLDLGTYAAGGLPLQFPASVTDREKMIAYYRKWRPTYAAGTHRVYSNPSIGLFGYLAARSMDEPFEDLMERTIFPGFGLTTTYISVPKNRMDDYAQGYSKDGKPVRVTNGVLGAEAYGVRTTAADMIRFLEANMDSAGLDDTLRKAIAGTQTGYFRVGHMTQGLGWETYAYPVQLDALLAGNSADMALKPNEVTRLAPPLPPRANALVNKTGSTRGFGAYAAFVPGKGIGIVMLANRSYPISARVTAAYRILKATESELGSADAR